MKYRFLVFSLLCINVISISAQTNNSMQAKGLEIIQQVNYISDEVAKGKISVLDNATIDKYGGELNINKSGVPLNQLASQTFQTITDANLNFSTFVNNSGLSQSAKNEMLTLSNTKKGTLPAIDFQAAVTNRVSQINANSGITEDEKKFLLTLCSIKYNLASTDITNNRGSLLSPFNGGKMSEEEAAFLGGCIGGIIGGIWGPTGVVVGILVGSIIGAVVHSVS